MKKNMSNEERETGNKISNGGVLSKINTSIEIVYFLRSPISLFSYD